MISQKRAVTIVVSLLFLFYTQPLISKPVEFVMSPACIEASRHISCLRLRQATQLLNQERALHPENAAVDYLEDFLDFYALITSQDIQELHRLEKKKTTHLHRMAALPDQSPYKLYGQAEIQLHWAMTRVFHQEYVAAALEFRDAYRLLERNAESFPFFYPNQKDQGLLSALLGSLPENFRWLTGVIGMKGDFELGLNLLANFTEHQSFTNDQLLEKQTGEYYYILLQMNFGDKHAAWNFCDKVTKDFRSNLMSSYLRAFVGLKTGRNEPSLEALNNRPNTPEYAPFPFLDYLQGIALLNRIDETAAIYFKRFITFNKGKNLIKDAYKRLSWYYLLNNDPEKYRIYQGLIQKYGDTQVEEDKQAMREAQSGIKPNLELLKARLYFDGGYYEKAESEALKALPMSDMERSEWDYRLGRIYAEQRQYLKAIDHYIACIRKTDPATHYYFPPLSCVQAGKVYETLGNKSKAIEYYQKALTYKGYEYRFYNSTKARQALDRLEK